MIFYFSGTGNSAWVAKRLAALTNDTASSIAPPDGPLAVIATGDAVLGLVFPVYAWGAPSVVTDFVSQLKLPDTVFTYAVCTCGGDAGNTMHKLQKKFPLKSAYSVTMPSNYILMSDPDTPEMEKSKIESAASRIPEIAEDIKSRTCVTDVHKGTHAALKTAIVNPLFRMFATVTAPFKVDDSCTGCGLCSKNCPTGIIILKAGRPVWKGKCVQCMSCISHCPEQAIQYGSSTRNRRRYVFPGESGYKDDK